MKAFSIIIVGLLLPFLGVSQTNSDNEAKKQSNELRGTIKIMSAPELFDISSKWADEFENLNPRVNIKLSLSEGDKSEDLLPSGKDIRIMYNDNKSILGEKTTPIILGREVFVAVTSEKNPFLDDIKERGVSNKDLMTALAMSNKPSWGSIIGKEENEEINISITDDSSVKSGLASYLGINEIRADYKLLTKDEISSVVLKDPYSLIFCSMSDILDTSGKEFQSGIMILPIDKNDSGILESHEDIYSNYDAFTRGVWIGKYPKNLYKNIYSVSKSRHTNESVLAFLEFIVTSGQQNLLAMGYDDLVYNEKRANLSSLFVSDKGKTPMGGFGKAQVLLALMIGLIFVSGILMTIISGIVVYRKYEVKSPVNSIAAGFDLSKVLVRNGLQFDKSHMWAFMNEEGNVKIGIDDFLQHVTGPITKVKMKMPGERIRKGEKILTIIQRGKRLNICSPVSGILKEYNKELDFDASLVNQSPYNEGWVYIVEPTNWITEIQGMLMGQKYMVWLKEELSRLKDFLASSFKSNFPYSPGIVMQEGGELKDGILNECGPEIWEEFQRNFIDKKA